MFKIRMVSTSYAYKAVNIEEQLWVSPINVSVDM